MISVLLPPATVLLLLLMRIIELRRQFKVEPGVVHAPGTFAALFWVGTGLVIGAVVEFFLQKPSINWGFYSAGLATGLAAFWIRSEARKALGKMWSVNIEIRENHQLVKTGPYRFVRHPIYVGAILEIVGAIVLLQSWWIALLGVICYTPALLWRVRVEEEAMRKQIGQPWVDYCATTGSVLPKWRR